MQLDSPGGAGFVDIFARLMGLRLTPHPSSGVPGGRIVSDSQPSGDLLVLLHELDHVTFLARPLGLLFTALGLQLSDSRSETIKRLNDVTTMTKTSRLDSCQAVVGDLLDWYWLGVCTMTLADITLPVMEGLAQYAESTLHITSFMDGPASFDLAVALEYQHVLARLRAESAEPEEDPRELTSTYLTLWERLLSRLSDARSRRGGYTASSDLSESYRATQTLFFGPKKHAPGESTAKHFLGYLYVVRLLQTWHAVTEGQWSDAELLSAANRLFGSVFTVFAATQVKAICTAAERPPSLMDFTLRLWCFFLEALELTADDISTLVQSREYLVFDGKITELNTGTVNHSATSSRIIGDCIFVGDVDERMGALAALTPTMDLHISSTQPVQLLGYDDQENCLLLGREDGDGRLLKKFPVRREALQKFRAAITEHVAMQPDGEQARPLRGELQVWLETWPDEVYDAHDIPTILNLVKIRRVALFSNIAVLDRDTPEDRAGLLKGRFVGVGNIRRGTHHAIGHGWSDFHGIAERVGDLLSVLQSDDDADYEFMANHWRDLEISGPEITRTCHSLYVGLLFPNWPVDDASTMIAEKLGEVFTELEANGADGRSASKILWQFLKKAVWRPSDSCDTGLPDAVDSNLELIRATCIRLLGIPLISMGDNDCRFDLQPAV